MDALPGPARIACALVGARTDAPTKSTATKTAKAFFPGQGQRSEDVFMGLLEVSFAGYNSRKEGLMGKE
jgi:hypothetical protein